MIDERINQTLSELETGLRQVDSARKQVEKTVNAYNGLTSSMTSCVDSLYSVKDNLARIVELVGKDYDKKVSDFEKDRAQIVSSCNAAIEKLSNATEEFKESLFEIQTKLKYSLIVNAVSLIAITAILILLLK